MQPPTRLIANITQRSGFSRFTSSFARKFGKCFISVPLRGRGLGGKSGSGGLTAGSGPFLHQIENRRNQKDGDETGSKHPADDGGTDDLTRHRAGARSNP